MGQFDVEIEVPGDVTEWVSVPSGVASLSEVAGAESVTLITGKVVKSGDGDDSVVELRVGSDILLVEIPNQRAELPVGGFISFQVPEVQLYPYDL
ncbi:hypothetical protein [Streptomyces sp. MNP-20]|uniref:hypothetical protein n=1 Tax=Streptomyces sp. MNP-20 TaxID=2721165 RepID=UPI001552A0E0|nr:hypothetical protein [Streptomyces sp. MNP-20]